MNAAVIKVKFADPAKPGRKQATIKAEDGTVFGVWPDKFGLFRPGRAYRVEFSEREYQGKTFKTITKCEPVADVEERTSDRGAESQRGSQHNSAEHEFVARILAASIQACAVAHTDEALIAEARMLRAVYRASFPG